jgi:hypothetical protein
MKHARYKLLTVPLCLLLVASLACGPREAGQTLSRPMWVSAESGLRMRASPSTDAPVITTIPLGSEVNIIAETANSIEIGGITGRWAKVSYQNAEGWVFNGFLTGNPPSQDPVVKEYKILENIFLTLNTDGTFSGECYDGHSGRGTWRGTYAVLPAGNQVQLTGEVASRYYDEKENIATHPLAAVVEIRRKNGERQLFSISPQTIPGCNGVTFINGVLTLPAYGKKNYWNDETEFK